MIPAWQPRLLVKRQQRGLGPNPLRLPCSSAESSSCACCLLLRMLGARAQATAAVRVWAGLLDGCMHKRTHGDARLLRVWFAKLQSCPQRIHSVLKCLALLQSSCACVLELFDTKRGSSPTVHGLDTYALDGTQRECSAHTRAAPDHMQASGG